MVQLDGRQHYKDHRHSNELVLIHEPKHHRYDIPEFYQWLLFGPEYHIQLLDHQMFWTLERLLQKWHYSELSLYPLYVLYAWIIHCW